MQNSVENKNAMVTGLPRKSSYWTSYRSFVVYMLMVGLFLGNLTRINLSMAMVCMVKTPHDNTSVDDNSTTTANPPQCKLSSDEADEYDGTINWNAQDQELIFAASYIGAIVSSIPAGMIADKFGAKLQFAITIAICMATSFVTPVAASAEGPWAVFVVRILIGVGQGLIFPCIASTASRWVPPDERSIAIGIYTAGNQLGMILGMPLFGFLCSQKQVMGGWPSIFYISGLLCVPWLFGWMFFVTNSPEENSCVRDNEKLFIHDCLSNQNVSRKKNLKTPWLKILTSLPMWACSFGSFAQYFSVLTLQTYLPQYFKEVLYLDVSSNGGFSALPFITQFLVKLVMSYIADLMHRKTTLSRTTICKIFNTIASLGNLVFILALSFLECTDEALAIVFLCIAQGMAAGFIPGWNTSLLSIAPLYSGTIRSISGLLSQVAGLIVPFIVTAALGGKGTRESWQTVFFAVCAVLAFCGIFFLIFGTAEIQPWAKDTKTEEPTTVSIVEMKEKPERNGNGQYNLAFEKEKDKEGQLEDNVVLSF